MVNIAVVEDDPVWRAELERYLLRFQEEEHEELSVQSWENGFLFLEAFSSKRFDLILLDIEMPHFSGMETARQIRADDETVSLIFITNMAQYALEGYEVSARDYLVKPVNYEVFRQRLRPAVDYCKRYAFREYITINRGGGLQKLEIGDICYIEVNGHSLVYHTVHGEYTELRVTLKERETQLEPFHFARCNNYVLLNLGYVKAMKNGVLTLSDGTEVEISRGRRKSFMLCLADYMGNRL